MRKVCGVASAVALSSALILAPSAAHAVGPEDGSVIQLSDGSYLPIYPVAGHSPTLAAGYKIESGFLAAYDQDGDALWSTSTTGTTLTGGFDFDSDGWPDVAVVVTVDTGSDCGASALNTSTLHFYSGANGDLHTPLSPMLDKCWTFPGTTYPTQQWTELAPLWGDDTNALLASPYYADTAWYLQHSGSSFTSPGALYFPSISAYDALYTAADPNTYPTGTDYIANSHVANGLITDVGGQDRAVFWTSGRVVQYAIGALGASQLISDTPYLTGGRTDIGGRNYGLVSVDPGAAETIALLAGTSNWSLFTDATTGMISTDPWGGLERHVSLLDASTATVQDRFFSNAHDNNDGNKYQYRLSYPANPWVERNGDSRLAFNVFRDGRWRLHVTAPGSTTSLYELDDVFLWDIVDLDGDGTVEWLISPTRYGSDPIGPSYYMPKWQTSSYHWNESALTLDMETTWSGKIPVLEKTFTQGNTSSSDGFLAPAAVIVEDGDRHLVMVDDSGDRTHEIP